MNQKPIYITSDVHLGAVPSDTVRSFIRWLEQAGAEASEILLNGDLFDFWFEYRSAIPRGHTRVLGALADVVDSGVPITLLGGNHDWWGGSYLTEELGISFHPEPIRRSLGGLDTLVAHGDGLGKGDLGYRMLKSVLRGRFTVGAFRWLHPDVGAWLANRVSRTGNREHAANESTLARAEHVRQWALARLEEDSALELVILGHTHIPVLEEVAPGRFYLNAGDWVYRKTYALLPPGGVPQLLEWAG